MITAVRLVDGANEMDLLNRDDFRLREIDIPFPAVREVSQVRTDTDGTDDTTSLYGSRAVSLSLRLLDNSAAVLQEIGAFMHPRQRPYLYVSDTDWPAELRLKLRASQGQAGIQIPAYPYSRDAQLQWVAPEGAWESADETEFVVNATYGSPQGRNYALAPPRSYAATTSVGLTNHTNPGTWAHQLVRMYGPCNGPRFTNEGTGETFSFTEELVIPAGDYVEIDTLNRTALYLSNGDASRLSLVDYAVSSWWRLAPGLNEVRYHPISGVDAGAVAVVTYRPTWLL